MPERDEERLWELKEFGSRENEQIRNSGDQRLLFCSRDSSPSKVVEDRANAAALLAATSFCMPYPGMECGLSQTPLTNDKGMGGDKK